jgi:site-specific DNA-methyltransferase (cytosine-N4-specific)
MEIYRVLGDEDIFWLNIGDTASGSGGAGGDWKNGARAGARKWKQGETGMAPMQWLNVPARVSIALQDCGWLLRHTLVWAKPRMRPEDLKHVRRPGVSHETVLMFAKTRKHRFYPERLVEKGSVWHMGTALKPHHTAAFPLELARRCIACSTEPGDVVFDPFAGSGTTMQAAEEMDRLGLGCDLYV